MFNKNKKTIQENEPSFAEELDLTEDRLREITLDVYKIIFDISKSDKKGGVLCNSEFLLNLYDKYEDKELLFAVYAGSRLLERITN